MSWPADRPRQFKLYLSEQEWQRLEYITGADFCSAADALRGFIHTRYEELYGSLDDPLATVDALVELSRKMQSLVRRRGRTLTR